MTGGGNGDFQVEPADVRKAGDNATQIGSEMRAEGDELLTSSRTVSSGMDGFALAGALGGCAQAWSDKLDSVAAEVGGVGDRLQVNAGNYEKADAAGKGGFDQLGGALVPPGS